MFEYIHTYRASLKVCCEEHAIVLHVWSMLHKLNRQEKFKEEDQTGGTCGRQVVLGRTEGADKGGPNLPISCLDHLPISMLGLCLGHPRKECD